MDTSSTTVNKYLSPDALLLISQARRIQGVAADLSGELEETLSFRYGEHSLREDAAILGERIRTDLGISTNEQYSVRTFEEFFEYLRVKLEGTGIITLKSGLPARAFGNSRFKREIEGNENSCARNEGS